MLAFVIWNLASRSPARLARDIVGSFRRPVILLRGILSLVVGLLLLVGSASLLLPLPLPHHALLVLITWTILTGLLVEQLVGPDLHARARSSGR